MKGQITGGGKNDPSSEVLSLVPSGEIFDLLSMSRLLEIAFDIILLNPFLASGLFLYPLQKSENL